MLPRHLRLVVCLTLGLSALSMSAVVTAQSRASNASVHASAQVPVMLYEGLKASGEFIVEGINTSAQMTVITISVTGMAASYGLMLAVEPGMSERSRPETSVGKVIETSGGLFLNVGAKVMAFIPEPGAQSHIHSRRLP